MKKQVLGLVLLAVLIIGGYLIYLKMNPVKKATIQPAPSLGAQIYTQTKNPVQDKVPDTNPFNQKTNPFEQ